MTFRCVEEEMADRCASRGISPLLAYELVHRYLPKASQELKLYILESVAQVDPINPLVKTLHLKVFPQLNKEYFLYRL